MENRFLIQVLEEINDREGCLSEESMRKVSKDLKIPLSVIFGVATFYSAFSLKPKGKHTVCVCTGTACHVRGAQKTVTAFQDKLKISAGETTADGKFTLKTVNCLGACALGPLVVVDKDYHGKVEQDGVEKLLKKYE